MGSKNCMNDACRATTSSQWKRGWSLKSGEFVTLCNNCGSAYENSVFCQIYHFKESGWRGCRVCGKPIHCGCIASRYMHEYMDFGGVGCVSCVNQLGAQSILPTEIRNNVSTDRLTENGVEKSLPLVAEHRISDDMFSTDRLMQLTKSLGANDMISTFEQLKREESPLNVGESQKCVPNLGQHGMLSSAGFFKMDTSPPKQGAKDMNEYHAHAQPSLNFSLATNFSSPSPIPPPRGDLLEGNKQSSSSFQLGQKAKNIFPKPFKHVPFDKVSTTQTRLSRPPTEGRGRNLLLPRYWPKITDQELQQLSGDLKSSIVPLFEKILSASDAGRIGRLVLPKACAEAYFPPISQSEGIPIRIQDIKGKQWMFQFRFWPNNNSRMYVLEGVTPCIQNMQVQAGDTVTFSRIDPGGQLVIGCRKAANNFDVHEPTVSVIQTGNSQGETTFPGVADILLSNGGRKSDDRTQQQMSMSEKKLKNIKNKRLLMHNDDAAELRMTWEEAQGLLRPSPSAVPTIFVVDGLEFEEFDEPPIFGKRTFFTSRPSGEQEQLAQCDNCSKWRRIPVHALLSSKWTCLDNIWDSNRRSCSAQEDIDSRELESLFGFTKESKRRRISDRTSKEEEEPSGLDALAAMAVLGDNTGADMESPAGATTRHPRHRPGCSCIVCIQPPSGKGKHERTCKCMVCSTVKRRFKTLLMRKRKKQSEPETELSQEQDKAADKTCSDKEDAVLIYSSQRRGRVKGDQASLQEAKTEQLDLNCDPLHEEEGFVAEADGMSSTMKMNASCGLPLDVINAVGSSPVSRDRESGGDEEVLPPHKVVVEQENNDQDEQLS